MSEVDAKKLEQNLLRLENIVRQLNQRISLLEREKHRLKSAVDQLSRAVIR